MSAANESSSPPEIEPSEPSTVERPFIHTTVLKDEVIAALAPRDGGIYLDATLGGGGHAEGLLEATPGAMLVAIDRDEVALRAASARLSRFGSRVRIFQGSMSELEAICEREAIPPLDGMLADLGVSSPQIDDPSRGMSFRTEGPLDMRMDRFSSQAGETALELIARLTSDDLANVLFQFGEERRSRRIARCIHQALRAGELHTTLDLRRAVVRAVGPARIGGIDPATRTFQAVRIAVNGELDELATLLQAAPKLLRVGGVLAVISFHSLEDRLVKRAFLQSETWLRTTRKPVIAQEAESDINPRSRSAKLRVARRGSE